MRKMDFEHGVVECAKRKSAGGGTKDWIYRGNGGNRA